MYEKRKFQYKFLRLFKKIKEEGVRLDEAIITYADVPYTVTIYKNSQYVNEKHRGIHVNLWIVQFRFDWIKKLKKDKWELRERYR